MFKNNVINYNQHFLTDQDIINKYISLLNIKPSDVVVEIGAGKGVLTKNLKDIAKKLYVIEIDKRLKGYLDKINNITVIYDNVLNVDIPACDKIVTSLPYNIIEPFIKKLINTDFKELYMLMGSNYVDEVLNYNFNRLSIITNSYFTLTKLLEVLPSSFDIKPHTLSYIVKLEKKNFNSLSNIYKLYNLLYYYQDKKIKNSLKEALIKVYNLTQKEAKNMISKLNIPEDILETKFEIISNEDLKVLNSCLNTLNKI